MRHMTDDELQAYLDKGTSSLDRVFDEHINDCLQCQQAIRLYRKLYSELSKPDLIEPSANFANRVVAMLAAEYNATKWHKRWSWFGISTGVLISIMASISMIGVLQPVKVAFLSATEPFVSLISTIAGLTGSRISEDQSGDHILVFGLLIMITVAIADALLKRLRPRNLCI